MTLRRSGYRATTSLSRSATEVIMCANLGSTLGTIVNGEPIGDHFRADDALLHAGENEVIAGGVESRFVFSVFVA
jgi:CRP/FNR family cyclic AMP-dependent transcriptional regulator